LLACFIYKLLPIWMGFFAVFCFFFRYIQLYLCHLLIIQKHIFFSISLLFTNAYSRKYAKTLVHIYMYTYNIKLLPHTNMKSYEVLLEFPKEIYLIPHKQ
jgi:hypothetical protein